MKKDYGTPIAELSLFDREDVITASVIVSEEDNMVFWPGTGNQSQEVFE